MLLDTGMRNPMVFERIPVNENDRKTIVKVRKNA